jgi:hypothetical protein
VFLFADFKYLASLHQLKTIIMNKMKTVLMFAFFLLIGTAAFAQNAGDPPAQTVNRTAEVIASIPSLHSISLEIASFEEKTKNGSESKNANADRRALKMKYAAELEVQIDANKNDAEVTAILKEELAKTRAEIETLK